MGTRNWTVAALMAATLVAKMPAVQSNVQTKSDEPIETIRISGRVEGIAGSIANVMVTLRRPGAYEATATTKSAEDGRFGFGLVPSNEYEVSFECPGFKKRTIRLTTSSTSVVNDLGTVMLEVPPESPIELPNSGGVPTHQAPISRDLKELSGVKAGPVDSSVTSRSKRRDVSLEEANGLVTAFLEDRGTTRLPGFQLADYVDQLFPAFHFFQAVRENPGGSGNIGYFAVDRKTGDVWSGVLCEKFTSSSLVAKQRALRNRIGLTDKKYQIAQRPGPMCVPGEKPRVSGPRK